MHVCMCLGCVLLSMCLSVCLYLWLYLCLFSVPAYEAGLRVISYHQHLMCCAVLCCAVLCCAVPCCPHSCCVCLQETTDTRDLPENLRRRIIEYFKYKYRDGKVRNQEEVLRELPYDMQVCVTRPPVWKRSLKHDICPVGYRTQHLIPFMLGCIKRLPLPCPPVYPFHPCPPYVNPPPPRPAPSPPTSPPPPACTAPLALQCMHMPRIHCTSSLTELWPPLCLCKLSKVVPAAWSVSEHVFVLETLCSQSPYPATGVGQ